MNSLSLSLSLSLFSKFADKPYLYFADRGEMLQLLPGAEGTARRRWWAACRVTANTSAKALPLPPPSPPLSGFPPSLSLSTITFLPPRGPPRTNTSKQFAKLAFLPPSPPPPQRNVRQKTYSQSSVTLFLSSNFCEMLFPLHFERGQARRGKGD